MKKGNVLALFLSVVLFTSILSACGGPARESGKPKSSEKAKTNTSKQESSPSSEASGTVRMMVNVTGGKDDEEMELFADALGKATGLKVEMEKPASDYGQVMAQKLNAGEKYDLIQMNAPDYLNLIKQDAFMDITDKVQASDILTNNIDPQEWKDITVDGKVYGGFNKKELHVLVCLNKVMLEKAGIQPEDVEPTLDGYYKTFKALKENSIDPDFYPFNSILSETWNLQPWFASVGLKNGVVADEDGQRYSPYAGKEAAPVWEWLKKLYDEELLDPASFVDKTKDMRDKMGASSQKTAVTADWAMWAGLHNANALAAGIPAEKYEIITLPGAKTPDGSYMLTKGSANLFAVPANAENPEGAIKILEYFATQDGGDLLSIGMEGHDYNMVDGKAELTEIGKTHAMDHGAPIPIDKDWKPKAGLNPGVEESMEYLKYATIDTIIPDEGEWKSTTGKWAIQIIRGETDTNTALDKMNQELISLDVVDK